MANQNLLGLFILGGVLKWGGGNKGPSNCRGVLRVHSCPRSVGLLCSDYSFQTLPQVEDSLRSWRSTLGVVGGHDTEAGNNSFYVCPAQEGKSS